MIGSIAGAALSIGSSIWGGIKARKAEKKYKAQLRQQEKEQNDWFRSRYNSDYTQRADVQALLNRASEEARKQVGAARGRQAVMGGTDESVSAAQAAANEGLSNTYTNIAAQASAYKDAVDQQNQQNRAAINQAYLSLYSNAAKNAAQAASEGMKAGVGLIGADAQSYLNTGKGLFANMFTKSKKTQQDA